MTGFFKVYSEMLTQPIDNGFIGWLFIILLWVLHLIALGLILSFFYWAIDSWFSPTLTGTGTVIEKSYSPPRTEITLFYNAATKSSIPTPTYHPADWSLWIELTDGRTGSMSVRESHFNKTSLHERFNVKYSQGRLSKKNIYIKELSRL